MGILNKASNILRQKGKQESPKPSTENIKLVFGGDYMTKVLEIKAAIEAGTWRSGNSLEIDFDQELLNEINSCIETHSGSTRVLYSDEMQFLQVVGESYRQEELQTLYNKVEDSWLSGVLMPEPLNPHDSNAVSVLLILPEKGLKGSSFKYSVMQAGHLQRDQAQKVCKKLIQLAIADQYIPILCKLTGGTLDKPNLGLLARAKTSKVKF
jgi:hypothetical protein